MFHSTNRNIFIFWDTGFDNAPPIVQKCLESWQRHHHSSKWEIHKISAHNVNKVLNQLPENDRKALQFQLLRIEREERCGDIVKFTDLLRLALLDCFGGIWVDATVYCLAPIESWLTTTNQKFLVPKSPALNRRHEAWLIVNLQHNQYLKDWKLNFRQLINSGCDFCDDWKFTKWTLFYWMSRSGARSPAVAARLWNSFLATRILKKQPYFSINYCAEYTLLTKHKYLKNNINIFIPYTPQLLCPSKKSLEQFEPSKYKLIPFIKLNHKWDCTNIFGSTEH